MAAEDRLLTVLCLQPTAADTEICISTTNIDSWDFAAIIRCRKVKIEVHRNRLIEDSYFFNRLLCGTDFRESNQEIVSIDVENKLESLIYMLRCIYDSPLDDIGEEGFLVTFQNARYFESRSLILKCETSFYGLASSEDDKEIGLSDLDFLWEFGIHHKSDSIQESCALYLAKNFMGSINDKDFHKVPYDLLIPCIRNHHLTIDGEFNLVDAILCWLSQHEDLDEICKNELLKEIRPGLLPYGYILRKLNSFNCSKLTKDDLEKLQIRLTKYSKRIDISSSNITSETVLRSLSPPNVDINAMSAICQQLKMLNKLPITLLTFKAVEEVDMSKCGRLHVESAMKLWLKSLPSLRKLVAAYLINYKWRDVLLLIKNCTSGVDIDIRVDLTPIIPSLVTFVSPKQHVKPKRPVMSLLLGSNIQRLTLEGRTDVLDVDLKIMKDQCPSLEYINLRGCVSATDIGISVLLGGCDKLHSILACYTSFGSRSIEVVYTKLASQLLLLHLGYCGGVDARWLIKLLAKLHKIENLCLGGTKLSNGALYGFKGSSLMALDVSNTEISGYDLAPIVRANPAMRCLKMEGCRNLIEGKNDLYFSILLSECKWESISVGSAISFNCLLPHSTMESIGIHCQTLPESVLTHIVNLANLKELTLCDCYFNLSLLICGKSLFGLTKLNLEKVALMSTGVLKSLTTMCKNLIELKLVGCKALSSDCLSIISSGWPGLISIHLEDCDGVTRARGAISPLFCCQTLETVLLRHNGKGLHRKFIHLAVEKLPMLRQLSLDACDAIGGKFEIPEVMMDRS